MRPAADDDVVSRPVRRADRCTDTVLAVFATGIGFLAMSVTNPGLTRSHTRCPGETWPSWSAYQQNPHSPEFAIH